MKAFLRVLLSALMPAVLMGLVVGCGSDLNEDHEESTAELHPFEDLAAVNHSTFLREADYAVANCAECHGEMLDGEPVGVGGFVERSCYTCHNNASHFGTTNMTARHSSSLRENGWRMEECIVCHTLTESAEGTLSFGGSCSSADCHHDDAGGPEACNVCHGNFVGDPAIEANWAPPKGLGMVFDPADPGIGAHQRHLTAPSGRFARVSCETCHTVPGSVDFPNHFDDSTPGVAEIHFDYPATINANPQYTASNASCSSTYCHRGAEPVWTQLDGTFNTCGSCHTIPPASTIHQGYTRTDCVNCHNSVINAAGQIISPELHVNGEVNRNNG